MKPPADGALGQKSCRSEAKRFGSVGEEYRNAMASATQENSLMRLREAWHGSGCVHFGMCTAVCPTYVLDGDERDSPRGRILLVRDMLDDPHSAGRKALVHLDRCLSCLACETNCAARVKYRPLIDAARETIEAYGVRSFGERLFRRAIAATLTSPVLLRSALALGRPFAGFVSVLPGRVGALGRLLRAPALGAFAPRDEESDAWPAIASTAPTGFRSVALLTGCVQSVLGREINAAARRLLERAGVRVLETGGCCGAMKLHLGYRLAALRQAKARVAEWHERLACGDVDAIVITASGCGAMVQQYEELFADDPEMAARASKVSRASLDITGAVERLTLTAGERTSGAVVAYHDACSMKHGLKIAREPRRLLRRLGFTLTEVPESHLCCGSAGSYNILQPAIAERLGVRKAAQAEALRPDVIAAGNLGCLVQVSRFTSIPVAHTVQLADWASGGPAPRGLEQFEPRPAQVAATESVEAPQGVTENFW
jgi:glycolate oxidase iron-sulfur subunit